MSYTRTILPDGSIVLVGEEPGLSADAIVKHLGTTGGTANARTLSGNTLTLAAGLRISFLSHTANSGAVTLDIGEGSGDVPVYFPSFATPNQPANLSANQLFTGLPVMAEYSASGYWVIVSALPLGAGNIPASLNATIFDGVVHLSSVTGLYAASVPQGLYANEADVGISLEDPAGGLYVSASLGTLPVAYLSPAATYVKMLRPLTATSMLGVSGAVASDGSDSAAIRLYSATEATYPGAHQQFAPLSTRAASTAFAVCPVATGDTARVEIHDNQTSTAIGAVVWVGYAGGVYFESGSSAIYVNSSSPASGEVGIYISAGVLYCKPGSGMSGIKIATFSRIGKA